MRLICFLLFVNFFSTAIGQSFSGPLPFDPSVKKGMLPNGLTYYIKRNLKPEKRAELRLVINAGSILEDEDQLGLAHFTEHMAFNGTKHFKKNELVSFLQSIGVKFGADLNASTGFEETIYMLPIPTEKKETLEKGFQILEDWAGGLTFDGREIENERGIVLEEARKGKGAQQNIYKVVYERTYAGSRYASRLPIGKEEILSSFKHDVIKRFYKDWYRPDLMAVIVVGDIDVFETEKMIKKHFYPLTNPKNSRKRFDENIPDFERSEAVVSTDKEATRTFIDIAFSGLKKEPLLTANDYRNHIIREMMFSMLNDRLREISLNQNAPFGRQFASSFRPHGRGQERFSAFVELNSKGAQSAITAIVQENERARRFGFVQSELDRTKKIKKMIMEKWYNERDKTESSSMVRELVQNFLVNEMVVGIESEYEYNKQFIEGITINEINQMAARLIPSKSDKKQIIYTGPNDPGFSVPSEAELLAIVNGVPVEDLKPFKETIKDIVLLDKKPVAGTIVNETINSKIGTTELKFQNGTTVILKPTNFMNDQVILKGFRFGGQYRYQPEDRLNAAFASSAASGIGEYSAEDVRAITKQGFSFANAGLDQSAETVGGTSNAAEIETMLQYVYLNFSQASLDRDWLSYIIARAKASVENKLNDPEAVFSDSLNSILFKHHPWAPRTMTPEMYDNVDPSRAFQIYKETFADANDFTFVIVGSFDIEKIKPLVAAYIGSLPSGSQTSSYQDVGLRVTEGPLRKEIRRGKQQKSVINLIWSGEAPYSGEEQLKLQAFIEVAKIKLIEILREEMGGVYSLSMSGSLTKFPVDSYSVFLNIPCGPENVEKLITRSLKEIEQIKRSGPQVADLNKVKENWKLQNKIRMTDNYFWLSHLIKSAELGADPATILDYEQSVNALTVKDIQQTAIKYISSEKYLQVVLMPENK